jgi:potassium-dependent mechanosensitive channel
MEIYSGFNFKSHAALATTILEKHFLRGIRLVGCLLFLMCMQTSVLAQAPAKTTPPSTALPPAPAETAAAPQPIAVIDIAAKTEAALASVRQLENRSRIDDAIQTATDQLPLLEREASYRVQEARRLNRSAFSLESIRSIEEELRDVELRNAPLRRELTRAASQADRDLKELENLEAVWEVTAKAAADASAPPDILDRVKDLSRVVAKAKKNVLDERARVLALLGRVTDVGTQLSDVRRLLEVASERAVTRLLYRDSPPLWSSSFWSASIHSFSAEARENIVNQTIAHTDYVRSHSRDFIFHGAFLAGLIILFLAIRERIGTLALTDETLRKNGALFDMPIVSAVLVAMLFSSWFYPRAPRSVGLMIGVIAAAPLLLYARRVIEKRIYQILFAVVLFFLVDRLRALFAPLPGVHRVFLLVETLSMLILFALLHRRQRRAAQAAETEANPDIKSAISANALSAFPPPIASASALAWRVIHYAKWLAFLMCMVVLACNTAGYARLADLVMRMMLGSAYTAVVLYILTRAGEGILHGLLYVPPLAYLAGVRRHRAQVAARINKWSQWLAFLIWVVLSLQGAGLDQRALALFHTLWAASVKIGSLTAQVSDVSLFFLILWTTYILSKLARFILEEEIFSRVRLDRGLPYAVSTTIHYIILLTGFVLALTAIGVDMTKFTIVAGALTVGIGFGLQNIVNNFVSGLIVLFERPVKVGDTIQIDDIVGRVQHIGIRATVIHSTTGAGVIIPNGKLISDRVTNWTLSSQLRQIAVPVITKPDIHVAELKATLLEVSRWNKQVLETPAPEVLFIKRGVDAFEFELRIWTNDLDAWLKVRSDIITDINEALGKQELPAQATSSVMPATATLPAVPPSQQLPAQGKT